MVTYDPYQYDNLEALLEKGLAPFGITADNIQENQHRVALMQHPFEGFSVVDDIWVDGQYEFSIRRELKHVEVAPGITSLMTEYEMFVKGEEK